MRRKTLGCFMLAMISVVCTSCQILPKEEELPSAPLIKEYEGAEYETKLVYQGDLVLSKEVICEFMPLKDESHRFLLEKKYIKGIYVKTGEQVQAGQLIAELSNDGLEEQIQKIKYEIEVLELNKQHLLERKALELQYSSENKEVIELKYAQDIKEIEETLSIKANRLDEIAQSIKEHQIFAGISGTVDFVYPYRDGELSSKSRNIITIYDRTSEFFVVEGEDTADLQVGSLQTVIVWGENCPTTVVSGSSYGLPEQNKNGEPIVYLRLEKSDYSNSKGTPAKINVVLDQRTNVLYVDKTAVYTNMATGEKFVYILGEDGMKVTQTVTTGLETSKYIEITSGLQRGDSIVVE